MIANTALTVPGTAAMSVHTPPASLPLTPLERRTVTALVADENAGDLVCQVSGRAAAFATGDPEVRRRAIGTALAVQEALVQQLSAHLAALASARQDKGVAMLDRALNSAMARFRSLADQLRIESAPTRRIHVMAKGAIAISAEETL